MLLALASPNWSALPYYLLDGLCIGAIYALIALGYTMVYGIIKLINFAHGEFYMVGGYGGYYLYRQLPETMSLWVSIPLTVTAAGLAGMAIAVVTERVAYKPIRDAGRLVALLTAIGVSFLLQQLFTFVNHGMPLGFQGEALHALLDSSVQVGGTGLAVVKLTFIPISGVLMAGLYYLTMHTRFGRAMRATSQDLGAARLMGINVDRVILATFAIGGFFGGVAGVLTGMIKTVDPMMGFMPGLIAFVAAVVGGIGSIPGAVIGGFLIGVLQNMVLWLGVPAGFKDVATFALLILVLVLRPQGLLGKTEREKV